MPVAARPLRPIYNCDVPHVALSSLFHATSGTTLTTSGVPLTRLEQDISLVSLRTTPRSPEAVAELSFINLGCAASNWPLKLRCSPAPSAFVPALYYLRIVASHHHKVRQTGAMKVGLIG